YEVPFERIAEEADLGGRGLPSSGLGLSHRGESVPMWIRDGGDGELGAGDGVRFIAALDRLWPRDFERDGPQAVLRLELDEPRADGAAGSATRAAPEVRPSVEEVVAPRRRLVLEEDRVRAPVASQVLARTLDSLWFWTPISQLASSKFAVDIGDLSDGAVDAHRDLEIRVRLLGWSDPELPTGESDHVVAVSLGGRRLGEARWDGQDVYDFHLRGVPAEVLAPPTPDPSPRLELRVVPRPGADGTPVVDVVYVDWVEIRYRVARLEQGRGPWLLDAGEAARLPDADRRPGHRLDAEAGWSAAPDPRGGWRLPVREVETEVWRSAERGVPDPERRSPVEAVGDCSPGNNPPNGPPGASLDYLMIVPPDLMSAVEPLADRHRRRGLRVGALSTARIADLDGYGYLTPDAIRRSIDRVAAGSPELRYVLLVGDADRSRAPRGGVDRRGGRGLVPTGQFISPFGPAASDHGLVADVATPAAPRFAVGRLPVGDVAELERVVEKLLRQLDAPRPTALPSVLLVSDRSPHSVRRRELSRGRLSDLPATFRVPDLRGDRPLDDALITALDPAPAVVHFNGHGSRHHWQLGASHTLGLEAFFDRDDVGRLAPTARLPVALSVSCTTAPFDHPAATSLGEVMLLTEGRGAAAFIGASSRLYTVPKFGESIIRKILAGESVGEALSATKRELGRLEVSSLYNLLGDPALPLAPADALAADPSPGSSAGGDFS
ncbi:MAG: C25 family cysteine peptidase, partial [Acidobacteriota bacterium]